MSPELEGAAARHREVVDALRSLQAERRALGAIRVQYQVPAYLDAPVQYRSALGIITGTSGPHLMVTLDDGAELGPVHPTDPDLVYLVDATIQPLEALQEPLRIAAFGILHRYLATALAAGGVKSW